MGNCRSALVWEFLNVSNPLIKKLFISLFFFCALALGASAIGERGGGDADQIRNAPMGGHLNRGPESSSSTYGTLSSTHPIELVRNDAETSRLRAGEINNADTGDTGSETRTDWSEHESSDCLRRLRRDFGLPSCEEWWCSLTRWEEEETDPPCRPGNGYCCPLFRMVCGWPGSCCALPRRNQPQEDCCLQILLYGCVGSMFCGGGAQIDCCKHTGSCLGHLCLCPGFFIGSQCCEVCQRAYPFTPESGPGGEHRKGCCWACKPYYRQTYYGGCCYKAP